MKNTKQKEDFLNLDTACCTIYVDQLNHVVKPYGVRLHAENDRMCRFDFRCFLMESFGMNEDLMMDRMFTFFDKVNNDGTVTREEWVLGLSVVLRGNLDELMAYAFFIYDLNQDGLISKEEMWCMLKDALFCPGYQEEADEGIRDLILGMFNTTFSKSKHQNDHSKIATLSQRLKPKLTGRRWATKFAI